MRHVFPTREVIHLWAHQSQSDGRNGTGSVFFEGPIIYSYGRHFPMARIYTKKRTPSYARDEGVLVLVNCAKRSVTTSGHQSNVRRAISHLDAIDVPCVQADYMFERQPIGEQDHVRNLAYFQREIAAHLDKAKRAMQVRTVEWRMETAQGLHRNAVDYSAFFGVRRKVPDFPQAAFDLALDRARRIETPDPVRDAAKIRARERKAAAFAIKLADYRRLLAEFQTPDAKAQWRAGEDFMTAPPDWWDTAPLAIRKELAGNQRGYWYRQRFDSVLLRVNGDQIETSQGARIPVAHAPRIWALVQACRNAGREYNRIPKVYASRDVPGNWGFVGCDSDCYGSEHEANAAAHQHAHSEHAGPYAIDYVLKDGTLKAGCHTISYDEIALMARTLQIGG